MRAAHVRMWFASALLGAIGAAGVAGADVTIERSSSILVFPKIIADGTRDTQVQITNTSNGLVRAHCFYVNAAPTDPTRPPGRLNPPLWIEVDFTIALTRQQPTQWIVSRGRAVNPLDEPCDDIFEECSDAGFDPGRIPPVVPDFVGELKCVEVDASGAPVSGNHLLGIATLMPASEIPTVPDGSRVIRDISKYNALGVLGDENNGDATLVLGGGQCQGNGAICTSDDDCGGDGPCVREYNACPETWILNHQPQGAQNIVLQQTLNPGDIGPSSVETEITIVPCTQNFETQVPTPVTLQFLTFNEFESQFSVSTSVTCWANIALDQIGATALTIEGQPLDPQGSSFLQTRIRSATGTPYGVFIVAEEFHYARPSTAGGIRFHRGAVAAFNPHVEGERPVPDLITIPADQLEP